MSTQYNDNEGNPWTLIIIILVILFAVLFFIAMIGLRPEIRSNTPEDKFDTIGLRPEIRSNTPEDEFDGPIDQPYDKDTLSPDGSMRY